MRIEDVKIKMYVANDGTEFYSQRECEEYEKSLEPFVVKPEWIERHEKQVAENENVKSIILEFLSQGEVYILMALYMAWKWISYREGTQRYKKSVQRMAGDRV